MPHPFARQMALRESVQFMIDHRHQLFQRGFIAVAPGRKQLSQRLRRHKNGADYTRIAAPASSRIRKKFSDAWWFYSRFIASGFHNTVHFSKFCFEFLAVTNEG